MEPGEFASGSLTRSGERVHPFLGLAPCVADKEDNTMLTSEDGQESFDWLPEDNQLELPFDEEGDD